MRVPRLTLVCIFFFNNFFGCTNSSGTNKIKVRKTLNPEADLFQFDGVINQIGIDWVEEITLTKDEQEVKSHLRKITLSLKDGELQ